MTKCPKIDTLYCAYNEIGTLDLTQSAELVWINCQNNRIDKLDVSNTKIGYLMAPDNRIASVNMGDKTSTRRALPEAATRTQDCLSLYQFEQQSADGHRPVEAKISLLAGNQRATD